MISLYQENITLVATTMDAFITISRLAQQARIMDQWKKIEDLENRYAQLNMTYYKEAARHSDLTLALLDNNPTVSDVEYERIVSEVNALKLAMTSVFEELALAQDRYNELVIEDTNVREEPILEDDESDEDEQKDELYDLYDIDMSPPDRKTRKDIMSLVEAVKAHKVQKTHKIKPRSIKRDRTKTAESKAKTLRNRYVDV